MRCGVVVERAFAAQNIAGSIPVAAKKICVAAVGKLFVLTCLGGGVSSFHEGWLPSGADCKPGVHCSTPPSFTHTLYILSYNLRSVVKTDAVCRWFEINSIIYYFILSKGIATYRIHWDVTLR